MDNLDSAELFAVKKKLFSKAQNVSGARLIEVGALASYFILFRVSGKLMIRVKKFFLLAKFVFSCHEIFGTKTQNELQSPSSSNGFCGGAVAEWSKALLNREKLSKKLKIPGLLEVRIFSSSHISSELLRKKRANVDKNTVAIISVNCTQIATSECGTNENRKWLQVSGKNRSTGCCVSTKYHSRGHIRSEVF